MRLGLIDEDDEHVRACLEQVKNLSETDSTISIGPNGRPVNGRQKKATHVYRDWAKTEAGKPVASALHRKLKSVGIWIWPTGDIESVLGLAGDKSEAEWAEFCRRLEGENLEECVAEVGLVEGVVSWLNHDKS